MASPAHITSKSLSGVWTVNKILGDSLESILVLQGVGWLTRKAIALSPVTQYIEQYVDAEGIEHIDAESVLFGGIKSVELRVLDGLEKHDKDDVFGHVIRKSSRVKVSDIPHDYLKGNCNEAGAEGMLRLVTSSDTEKTKITWILDQVWGFEEIEGVRRSTERLHFTGPKGEIVMGRLVYDFVKLT